MMSKDNSPFSKKRTDEEIEKLIGSNTDGEKISQNQEKIPHKFNIGLSLLIWLGISLLAAVYVAASMYFTDKSVYEEYTASLITITVILSTLVGFVSVFVNWIVTSLILFGGLKAGKNAVTYRSVLYYYLKNSWVYAAWIGISVAMTFILKSGNFLTGTAGIILSAVCMAVLYLLIYLGIKKDFEIKKSWVYFLIAAIFTAIIVITLIYSGSQAFSSSLSTIGG